MYALRNNAPDFTFQKKKKKSRQKFTIWSGMNSNGILLGQCIFVCNVNNDSYLHILDNFVLAQLQDFFNIQLKVTTFNVYGKCKMELQLIGLWQ